MNSADQMAEFLESAAHNVRKILEDDPETSAEEIETVVNRLPQVLREAAPFLAQCEAED